MLSRLLANTLFLLASAFAQRLPLHVEATVPSRALRGGIVAPDDNKDMEANGIKLNSTAEPVSHSHFSSSMVSFSERRLVTPITNTTSLGSAIEAWCQNSTQATEKYGDISTWYIKTKLLASRTISTLFISVLPSQAFSLFVCFSA